MTTHDRFLELVSAEMDFELTPAELSALRGHLAGCAVCRGQAEALRSDARAIAALPAFRPTPEAAEVVLGRIIRSRPNRVALRLVAIAALLALAALAAAAVGAELLRQSRNDGLVVAPSPQRPDPDRPAASPTAALPRIGWQVAGDVFEIGTPEQFTTIASSVVGFVAVGGQDCTVDSGGALEQCFAQVYHSPDGRSWTRAADTNTALELGTHHPLSGPGVGMVDVAGSDSGFVVIGYAGDADFGVAIWTSPDGRTWERQPPDPAFASAQVTAVARSGGRWIVAGSLYLEAAPRAAAWVSTDGRAWQRAPDGPVFEVGGYIDTGEHPDAGGMTALATDGATIVGSGQVCDTAGGSCVAAVWSSVDGLTWTRELLSAVTADGQILVGGRLVQGEAGYLLLGTACLETGCTGSGAWSADGQTWAVTDDWRFGQLLALAPSSGGFIAAVQRQTVPPGLILVGSTDGLTWTAIDGVPNVDGALVSNVDLAMQGDGSVLVVARYSLHDGPSTTRVFQVLPPS